MIQLDLSVFAERLKSRQQGTQTQLWCPVRRKWVARTPEEIVRQLMIEALLAHGFARGRMAVEQQIRVNRRSKRVDILVYDAHMQPWLLVECKAPTVKLTDQVFGQAAWYNMTLEAPWLVITNGLQTFCAHIDREARAWTLVDALPRPE